MMICSVAVKTAVVKLVENALYIYTPGKYSLKYFWDSPLVVLNVNLNIKVLK